MIVDSCDLSLIKYSFDWKDLQIEREQTLEKLENVKTERNQLTRTCKVSKTKYSSFGKSLFEVMMRL